MYSLKTKYHFSSAHFLTEYYGKCENLHGHNWQVVCTISAPELQTEDPNRDMVIDFGVFKKEVRALCDALDHTFLVEKGSLKDETIAALESEGFSLTILPFRTTAENLARYIAYQLERKGFTPSCVEVYETENNCAIWTWDK